MECDHSVEFFPRMYDDPLHPHKWWHMTRYVIYRWHCWKCGVEMEPVFRVKGENG